MYIHHIYINKKTYIRIGTLDDVAWTDSCRIESCVEALAPLCEVAAHAGMCVGCQKASCVLLHRCIRIFSHPTC